MKNNLEHVTFQHDRRILEWILTSQRICIVFTTLIAVTVLGAWLLPPVANILPDGWSLMKANTALSFTLVALCQYSLLEKKKHNFRILRWIFIFILLIITSSALFNHISGGYSSIETLLAKDNNSPRPGLMSLQTASFLFVITLIFSIKELPKQSDYILDILTLVLITISLIISSGYIFDAIHLYGQSLLTRTSVQTLICMLLSTYVALIFRTKSKTFSILINAGFGSSLARYLTPLVILFPFIIIGIATTGMEVDSNITAITASISSVLLFLFHIFMTKKINDLEKSLRELSLTDELTKIYNRRGLYTLGDHLYRESRRNKIPMTVIFFDLDGLKKVNDTYGHDTGSELIKDFACLLQENLRDSDILARVGGDEFVIITHNEDCQQFILNRFDNAVKAFNESGKKIYEIHYSAGMTYFNPDENRSFSEIIDEADAKMYQIKIQKKSNQMMNYNYSI